MRLKYRNCLHVIITLLINSKTFSQETCEPTNCIISEWNNWSDCTATCGEDGVWQRFKTVYQEETCGGTCTNQLEEFEQCNIRCCPKDCVYSDWTKWGLCFCDPHGCGKGGERFNCQRSRTKVEVEDCGGYCDDVTVQQECGNLCCYQNCAVSEWSFWGACEAQCEQTGTMRRTRVIEQEPRCHGKRCGPLEEVVQCRGGCCPVDCILGEWSAWSICDVKCGESTQTRVRFVRLPKCGGDPCPEDPVDSQTRSCRRYVNTDCLVTPWSPWSDCFLNNGFCGKAFKTRSRSVDLEPECQGQPCGNLTESGVCYGPCCSQDCIVSEWTIWSHCSASCGRGISNRTRSITQSPSCGGSPCINTLFETKDCVVRDQINCEFTDWSTWTACSNDCGLGVKGRTRTLITPSYCGGQCRNEAIEEEIECESYDARQDCEVSKWSDWGPCIKNCARGDQARNRTIIVNPVCNGTACPIDLVQLKECHLQCAQLCNQGVCSCKPGYRLATDNVTCIDAGIKCSIPKLNYCPRNYRELEDCRHPYFRCLEGYRFNKTCTPYCSPSDWILKGVPDMIRCKLDGTWTQPEIFCARPNRPPIGISVDNTIIEENKPIDSCFAYLSTITDGEEAEIHTYSITEDVTDRFYIRNNRLCLKRVPDFEEEPARWEVTFRSTDIEGEFVEEGITFEIVNANDPPSSVKLEPNTVPENSPVDTVVGCLSASDDDPIQNVSLTLVDTAQGMFATFRDEDKLCIKVVVDSAPKCRTEGGIYCKLNKEVKDVYFITVLAADNGTPPMSAYYDVAITLTDENDRQTSIEIEPNQIPEERNAGESLIKINTIDEDIKQKYTYTLLDDNDGLFEVSGNTLRATRKFDYEKEIGEVFEITIESTDDDVINPLKISRKITIQIADVNERPFDLHLSSIGGLLSFNLNMPKMKENVNSAVIGTISVKDHDLHDSIQIILVGEVHANNRISLNDKRCSSLQNVNVYCTSKLILNEALNFEAEDHINIAIVVKDSLNLTTHLNLTLEVINTNDPPTKLLFDGREIEEMRLDVPENQEGLEFAIVTAYDEDEVDTHTFELVDSPGGLFQIENTVLKISDRRTLDYELKKEHQLKVRCTDNGNPPASTIFNVTIIVVDVNEPPVLTTLDNNKIRENSVENTVVGSLTTIDPDNEIENRQLIRYTMPDNADGRFKIDGNMLVVQTSTRHCGNRPCALDFEVEPKLYVTVITMDNGIPRMERIDKFAIELEDANDPPTDIQISNYLIKENEQIGSTIGTLSAFDQDGVETLTFVLKNNQELFMIKDGNTLVTNTEFDYEFLRSYSLLVSVTGSGEPPTETEEVITIYILDVNEAPSIANISGSIHVPDVAHIGVPIITYTVTDPDEREIIVVSIDDWSNTFYVDVPDCVTIPAIEGTKCEIHLITSKVLDANVDGPFDLLMIIQDSLGLTTRYELMVNIDDVNNAPNNILVNGFDTTMLHIPENRDITNLAVFEAVDADVNQTHGYRITRDTSGHLLVSGNVLQSAVQLDFESKFSSISFTLEGTDSGSPAKAFKKSITVFVDDVNEPPTRLHLSNSEVEENSPLGTVIGNFKVEDPDVGQSFETVLLSNPFGIFKVEDNILKIGKDPCSDGICRLDYEKEQSLNIKILVKDSGFEQQSSLFDIQLTLIDLNEPPTDIKLKGNKVIEGVATGALIGTLTATDDDFNQEITFQLIDNTNKFEIDSANSLVLKDGSLMSAGDVVHINVKATDNGTPTASADGNVTVIVTSDITATFSLVSEGLDKSVNKADIEINENIPIGEKVAVLNFLIKDQETALAVSLLDGSEYLETKDVKCIFVGISSNCSSKLYTKSIVDFERTNEIRLVVKAVSDEGLMMLEYANINILDVNEQPVKIEYSCDNIIVQENSENRVQGIFHVEDPDVDDQHTFEMYGSSLSLTSDGQLLSSANSSLDYETTTSFEITVMATDKGGLSINETFTVFVIDVNEKPTGLNISDNKVSEMSIPGTEVGMLQVSDPDVGQEHTYTFVSGNENDVFAIENGMLMVAKEGRNCSSLGSNNCALDYETKSSYLLSIKVKDEGQPSLSEIFTVEIIVADINDKPTSIALSSTKINENTPSGSAIADITAYDEDTNHFITFNVFPNDVFYVQDTSLILNTTIDFETMQSYDIIVSAMDDGDPVLSASSSFLLQIIDENETPYSVTVVSTPESDNSFEENKPKLNENLSPGAYIGEVIALDPDTNDNLNLQIIATDLMIQNKICIAILKATRCTWDLRSSRSFDFEKENSTTFSLIVTDAGGLQIKKDVVLSVMDRNDAPTDILLMVDGTQVDTLFIEENTVDVVVAYISVEDEELDQSYIYDLLDDTNTFYISGDQLHVTSSASLDFERMNRFTITLTISDSGTPPLNFGKQFNVEVTDINEPPLFAALSKTEVDENASIGEKVGRIVVEDPDNVKDETQTFHITLLNDQHHFGLEGSSIIVLNTGFNQRVYNLAINISDDGKPPLSNIFDVAIYVIDVNDAPVRLGFTGNAVMEDLVIGSVIGQLEGRDNDIGQSLTYSILGPVVFSVQDRKVVVSGPLNFEVENKITFTARVTDDGQPPLWLDANFTVEINDVNEPPKSIQLLNNKDMTISERMHEGDIVGIIEVTDEDISEVYEGSVDSGEDKLKLSDKGFTCNRLNSIDFQPDETLCVIELQLAAVLDYETKVEPLVVTISVRDKGGLERKQAFTFTVTNFNEPPKDLLLDSEINSIPENTGDFVLGGLSVIDDDRQDIHTFQVISHWEIFTVIGNKLIVRSPLDYESKDYYIVRIRTNDDGTPQMSFTKEFVFNILNLNEAPSDVQLSHTEVEFGAEVGTIIGNIIVTDPDNIGNADTLQTHTCAVSPDDFFQTDHSNTLVVKRSIPYELNSITISITCFDSGRPALSRSQEIDIRIVENVNPPKGIQFLSTDGQMEVLVDENVDGITLGQFSVINLLTKMPINAAFAFHIENNQTPYLTVTDSSLILTKPMNFEDTQSFEFTVKAEGTDQDGQQITIENTFKINVNDVNEAPISIGIYGDSTVAENSHEGTVIGDLYTIDPEDYQTYAYKLLGVYYGFSIPNDNDLLDDVLFIDDKSLMVGSYSTAINFEISDIITVLISATDSGNPPLSFEVVLRIQVQNMNDPPTDIYISNFMVAEDSTFGSVVGTLIIEDEDEDEDHSCEILNLVDVPFRIVEKIEIVVDGVLDYESQRKYYLRVSCGNSDTDISRMRLTKTLSVNITDVNEPPSYITVSATEIQEGNFIGQVVTEIKSVDLDSTNVTLSLAPIGDWKHFEMEGDSTLVAKTVFDFEVQQYYTLTIEAMDDDGLKISKDVEIQVIDVNEAPTSIILDRTDIKESKLPGDKVGELTTVDPDRIQNFQYSLDTETALEGIFIVDGSFLVIGPAGIDYEEQSEYVLSLTSTDDGTPAKSIHANFTLTILDVNEPPTDISTVIQDNVPENSPTQIAIGSVRVEDPDTLQRHSCRLNDSRYLTLVTNPVDSFQLVLLQPLNYEVVSTLYLEVSCTDGDFEISKVLSVNVRDINEPPTAIILSGSHTVKASVMPGHVIGQLTAEDEDQDQILTFSVVGPNSDIVNVNSDEELVVKSSLPTSLIEQQLPSLYLTIYVADSGDPVLTMNQTFNIIITSINIFVHEIPKVGIENKNISENSLSGTVIGELFYIGSDSNENLYMSIEENFENLFEIRDDEYLTLADDFTNSELDSIQITIKVTDTKTQEFKLTTLTLFVQRTCAINETMCTLNESCVVYNSSYSQCECKPDFENNSDGICSVKDNCLLGIYADPVCKNGGTCIDDVNSFVCKCPDGFGGYICEVDEREHNPCEKHDCQNGAICIPDIAKSTYNCSCRSGWQGSNCNKSQDECIGGTCYNGGTCVDEYLTYLCDCSTRYKGLRCEYSKDICNNKYCNETHICVGIALSVESICVLEEKYVVELVYELPREDEDIRVLQPRLVDFIIRYGGLPTTTSPSIRKKRSTDSLEVQVYVVEAERVHDDRVSFKLVVLDENMEPFTRETVLAVLSLTCVRINSGDLSETTFCPTIIEAATKPQVAKQQGSSAGFIIGVICVVTVPVLVVVILLCIVYKKKKDNAISPEVMESATDSRRSSGYSSITKTDRPWPSPKTSRNKVSTLSTADTPPTSVFELETIY